MRTTNQLVLLLLCIVVASGCAKYVPPTSGPIATVKFINLTDMNAVFRAIDNEECERGEKSGILGSVGGGIFRAKETVQTIEANRVFVVAVQGTGAKYPMTLTCSMTVQFFPRANEEYEIEYSTPGSRCLVSVFRVVRGDSSVARIPELIRFNPRNCRQLFD